MTCSTSHAAHRAARRHGWIKRIHLTALLGAFCLLGPGVAHAQLGVSDDRVSLPDGPGSMGGAGQNTDMQANMGSMSYAVALEAPPGFAGATPSLALTYSSMAGNADVGIGWELMVPSIERHLLRGVPRYDADDAFAVNGSEELVQVAAAGSTYTYRARFEGGFVRYTWHADAAGAGGYFEAEYPDGSRGFFGADEHGQPVEAARLSRDGAVFRYLLVVTLDRFGHAVRYDYNKQDGYPLLREVSYLFTRGAPRYRMRFSYKPRADVIRRADMGFEVALARRLARVEVTSEGTPLRTYLLDYEETNTGTSRLVRVRQTGRGGTPYPAAFAFAYTQSLAVGCSDCTRPVLLDLGSLEAGAGGGVDLQNGLATLIDINGDSLPDLLDTGRTGRHRFFLNTMDPDGAQRFGPAMVSSRPESQQFRLSEPGVQVVDVNGDGFTDMIHTVADQVLCNRGQGDWSASADCADSVSIAGLAPDGPGDADPLRIRFMDYDGDRRIDLVRTASPDSTTVIRNAPDGFHEEVVDPIGAEFDASPLQLGDINGDGLLDPVLITNSGTLAHRIHLGHGRWSPWREQALSGATSQELEETDLQDMNGDGLDDVVIVQGSIVKIALNRAGTFLPFAALGPEDVDGGLPTRTDSTSVLFADINGSGTTDVVWISNEGQVHALELYAIRPNLLTRIDNGLGGIQEIEYGTSAREQARDEAEGLPWRHRLPQAMNVVTAVASYATLTPEVISRREMRYHHGLYDGREKRYRGFEVVELHDLADLARDSQEAGLTILDYDLGAGSPHRAGLLLREQVFGGSAQDRYRIQRVLHEYDDCPLADVPAEGLRLPVRYACEVASETLLQEGRPEAEWVTVRESRVYDGYGNVTREVQHGVTGMGADGDAACAACTAPDGAVSGACGQLCLGDEAYSETEYIAPGPATGGAWLLGQPSRSIAYGSEGGEHTETSVYYDGEPFVGLARGELTRGLVSRVCVRETPEAADDCEGPGWIAASRSRHDEHGNVVEILDPLGAPDDDSGHRRRVEYDAYQLKPVAVELFLSGDDGPYRLRREMTYDPLFYEPVAATRWMLVGAPARSDPAPTLISYDDFGRRAAIALPGDTLDEPTSAFEYVLADPVSQVVLRARSKSGAPFDLEQRQCVDGFGRVVQTRTHLGDDLYQVTGFNEVNRRDQTVRAYQPYQSSASACDRTAPAAVAYTSFRYDAAGRPVVATSPDAAIYGDDSVTTTTYAPLMTIARDAEDNDPGSPAYNTPHVTHMDGLGRIVTIERHLDAAGTAPAIAVHYDSLGRLRGYRDAAGHVKVQRHDLLGRVVAVDDPNAGQTTYEYDAAGNLVMRRDARGVTTRFAYDGANRPLVHWDDSDPEATRVRFRYDFPDTCPAKLCANVEGKLAEVLYPVDIGDGPTTGRDRFGFDVRGRPVYQARVLLGHELPIERTFDNADRLVRTVYPDGQELTRSYDGASRLAGIDGVLDGIAYDERGQLEHLAYHNGASTWRSHDSIMRLSELVTLDRDGQVLQGFAYARDRTGSILTIDDLAASRPGHIDASAAYTYDAWYRLVTADLGGGDIETLTHRYDASDNILSATSSRAEVSAEHMGDYAYDPARPNAVVQAGGRHRAYDDAGHVVERDRQHLRWDHLGRLAGVDTDAGEMVARFAYGAGHERVVKREADTLTLYIAPELEIRDGISVLYARVGRARVARMQTDALATTLLSDLAPLSGSGASSLDAEINAADAWIAHAAAKGIVHIDDATTPSEPVALLRASARRLLMEADAKPVYLHSDHLGSLTLASGADGEVLGERSYYPFGEVRGQSGYVDARGFTGQERDQSTGLLHFQYRYLDTSTGRWMSPDPLFAVSDAGLLRSPWEATSVFTYVGNQSINAIDPTGLKGERLKALAKSIYNKMRKYHGTTAKGKKSIQEHGMSIKKKEGGATEGAVNAGVPLAPAVVARAKNYNYLARTKSLAGSFAKAAQARAKQKKASDEDAKASLVRALVTDEKTKLETDDDFEPPEPAALRTRNSISSGRIRGSSGWPDEAVAAFKAAVNEEIRALGRTDSMHTIDTEAARAELESLAGSEAGDDDAIAKAHSFFEEK